MKCILAAGEFIDITLDGLTVRVTAAADGDGSPFLNLGGIDCSLTGEQPGMYYLEPLSDRDRLQAEVDTELARLDALPATPPMGGWRNEAIRTVAVAHAMNPYSLDHLLRGVVPS